MAPLPNRARNLRVAWRCVFTLRWTGQDCTGSVAQRVRQMQCERSAVWFRALPIGYCERLAATNTIKRYDLCKSSVNFATSVLRPPILLE